MVSQTKVAHVAGMLLIFALSMTMACKKPPNQALSDAEKALLNAEARRECADDKYLAAEKLLNEAKALVKEKKYDEAERKAIAAQKMAEEARASADASWEECQRRKNVVVEATKPAEEPKKDPPKEQAATLSTLYFAYDSAEISPAQREQLEQNALWIRQHSDVKTMVLEGHTDERGSVEYNLALGERRAQAVRQYLIQLGIDRDRLNILSYGEEKPVAYGGGEDDYRQNRRVEFTPKK